MKKKNPKKIGENTGKDPITGQFVEGNPGGPGRTPGTKNFTTKVREALEQMGVDKDGKAVKYDDALVRKVLELAIIKGHPKMIELVWNYLDGKPTQTIVPQNPDGSNLIPQALDRETETRIMAALQNLHITERETNTNVEIPGVATIYTKPERKKTVR